MSTATTVREDQAVHSVFLTCQLKTGEDLSGSIPVRGIIHDRVVRFNASRIEENRQVIHNLLSQLPDQFKSSGGGGDSFEETHINRHGNTWARIPIIREQLVQLGLATGEVELLDDHYSWSRLPGGVPRLVVKQ
jgi:hypothetical protein